MMIVRLLSLSTVLLVLVGCPSTEDVARTDEGWLIRGEVEVRDTTERTVGLGARDLTLDIPRGSVSLRGGDVEEAQLTFVRAARAGSQSAAEQRLERISIDETGDGEHYEIAARADRQRATEVHVTGILPRNVSAVVRMDRGSVDLSGIDGRIDVRIGAGNVEAEGLRSSHVTVRTDRGNQHLAFAAVREGAEITLTSANGDVTVTLPTHASLQVTAETSIGAIGVEGLRLSQERFEERRTDTRYRGRLDGGAGRLLIQTEVGNIRLQGSQPTERDGE